jgi:hypothetical protein
MSNLSTPIQQIKSEFQIDLDGRITVSIRGAARLAGIADSSLIRAFKGAAQKASKLSEFLAQNGFEGAAQKAWAKQGIPDVALALILEYYAYECQPRYRTQLAKKCCRAFHAIGIRAWIHQEAGWQSKIALTTQMEARITEIVEERISIATESLTTKIVEQVSSALAEQLPLEELRSQVGEIYEDMSERKNRRRSWYLPADTPKDKIPDDYIEVSDGWLSPAAFEYQRRRNRWEMFKVNS